MRRERVKIIFYNFLGNFQGGGIVICVTVTL